MNFSKKILLLCLPLLLYFSQSVLALENHFYMLRDDSPDKINDEGTGFASLQAHVKDISILTPQAYEVDREGIIWGGVDERIIALTAANQIKLMPMVTNVDFSYSVIHEFLHNSSAQDHAIQALLSACQKNHYYGIQFDLEGIHINDRDALSAFYAKAATIFHKNGFAVSATVVPMLTTFPNASAFLQARYENWAGAYDYKALASSCDFLTLMAYDQHNQGTTPGPVASLPWVEDIIQYALQQVDPQKIFLGIPVYSDYWYVGGTPSGKHVSLRFDQLGYSDVQDLLKKFNVKLNWDSKQQIPFAMYDYDWLYQYIFAEDAKSFKAKYDLAKKYHLRGISVWRMGMEDPAIWKIINKPTSSHIHPTPGKSQHKTIHHSKRKY